MDPMKIDETVGYLAAIATSRDDGRERYTELRVYYMPQQRRCWLAQADGVSLVPGEKLKRRRVASASLERALKLFDASDLGIAVTQGALEYAFEHGYPITAPDGRARVLLQHEALHAAQMVEQMVDAHLSDHRYIAERPHLAALAGNAGAALAELYQAIGAADHG